MGRATIYLSCFKKQPVCSLEGWNHLFKFDLDQRFPVCGMRNMGFVQVVFGTGKCIVFIGSY